MGLGKGLVIDKLIKIMALAMIMLSAFVFTYILLINLDNRPVANHFYLVFFVILVLLLDGIVLYGITSGKFKQTTNLHSLKSYILLTIVGPIVASSVIYLMLSMKYPERLDLIARGFYKTYLVVFAVCFLAQVFYFFRSYLETRKQESA